MLIIALVALLPAAPIVEGFANKDNLWLRDSDGVVKVYNRATGDSDIAAQHVIAMDRTPKGALMALRVTSVAGTQTMLELRDVAALATLSVKLALEDDAPVALIADADPMILLTTKAVITVRLSGGESLPLTLRLSAGANSGVTMPDGVIIGFAKGGLYTVNRTNGLVREVKLDGAPFDAVASVITDTTKPGCALVAAASKIARVCGGEAELVFAKGATSLVAASKGWVAIGGGKLMRSKSGKVKESAQPKLVPWHGLEASFSPDAIIVGAGATPLLLPTM